MRISDWSSDVCSSDLNLWNGNHPSILYPDHMRDAAMRKHPTQDGIGHDAGKAPLVFFVGPRCFGYLLVGYGDDDIAIVSQILFHVFEFIQRVDTGCAPACPKIKNDEFVRSEEHTSELQSLMRIS